MHGRRRLYLDIVPNGLPFLPHAPVWHELTNLNTSLRHFELDALEIVDVVYRALMPELRRVYTLRPIPADAEERPPGLGPDEEQKSGPGTTGISGD